MNSVIKERVVLHALICLVSGVSILATGIEVLNPTSTSSSVILDQGMTGAPAAADTPFAYLLPYPACEFARALLLRLMTAEASPPVNPVRLRATVNQSLSATTESREIKEERFEFPTQAGRSDPFCEADFLASVMNLVCPGIAPRACLMPPAGWWRWGLIALAIILAGLAMLTFEQYGAARMKELNRALLESKELTVQLTVQQVELGKAYRTLALDYAVIRALNESPGLPEAAQQMLQTICVSTGWDIGVIWDVDRRTERRCCLGVWQKPVTPAAASPARDREPTFSAGTRLFDSVLGSGQPQWLTDLTHTANLSISATAQEVGVGSGFGFPILSGGEIIGVLEFYSYAVRQPEEELGQILVTIASHLGQLIERRRAEEALAKSRNDHLVELQRVRRRIATDLHDDVGSSLTKIALISETLRQQVAFHNPYACEQLTALTTISNELVETMSDIVWAINPKNDRLSTLSQRMRRYASDMFTARQIRFRFQTPDGDAVLGANLRREVFLIFKESVNNVIKHAQCSEVVFALAVKEGRLSFTISDNGRGIDAQIVKADTGYLASQLSGGNGLSNMRRRAREMGGQFEIMTGKGQGTTVAVKFPFVYGLPAGN